MISITPSSLIDRAKAAILRGVDSFTRAILRKSYELAFALAMLTPAFTSRAKKARRERARRFALKVRENTEKHGALGIAIMINAGVVTLLGMTSIVRYTPRVRESMECTFEGFITKTPEAAKPPGGGGGGSADPMQAAVLNAGATMPTMAVPVAVTMPSVIHFEAPKAPAVEVPAYTPAKAVAPVAVAAATPAPQAKPAVNAVAGANVSADEFAKRLEKLRNRSANNGQGTGTGPGTGSGTGGGNGSGTGKGQGRMIGGMMIQAEHIGVIIDSSSSMEGHAYKARQEAWGFQNPEIKDYPDCVFDANLLNALNAIANKGIDVLVWVTDLQNIEKNNQETLDKLAQILKEHHIKLYVHSWEKYPTPEFAKIIEDSGGSFSLK